MMIPVTLLTGFLGAGKTTLLNRLMAAHPDQRFAIIENEFGAAGIDGSLISPGATQIIELSNGCICCSVRGELATALTDLLAQREAGSLAFDRLVIETTGLADPGPVIQTFFWEERLREAFQLDAVITLVDVCHITGQLDREAVAGAQVAYADWIIITKTDLAGLHSVPERLATINARAPLIDVRELDAHWPALLATGGFSLGEKGLLPEQGLRVARAANERRNAFGQKMPRRSWDDAIGSLLLEADAALDLDAVSAFVDRLIAEHANDLLRYKGILAIAGEPRRLVFQGVHRLAGFDYGRPWGEHESQRSRIVLIGRDLPEDALRASFAACCEGMSLASGH
ncbi:CobW family GTP-binding protein [Uliginosibacterium paludis]|uniref:GTP-binding protein n=1 Tax=Uliginosibacterium paludis TaxID=1615952 RepID=A0ABV2CNA7_9RHOO